MDNDDEPYDISKYTDKELYDILDLNNPSDRELEAKILNMIQKYESAHNDKGYKLAVFFQNIYDHFFDEDIEEEEGASASTSTSTSTSTGSVVEGYTNTGEMTVNGNVVTGNITIRSESLNPKTNNDYLLSTDIIGTQIFNYKLDKFGINPLLKETISRIVSIDSQYRNDQTNMTSTNYTIDLSEPIKDVVSLTLETVQMPFSWYTINKSYGSNFFIIKGRNTEIDTTIYNGHHDYKIEIPPGNYVLDSTKTNYICSTIQQSITDLSNIYTDTNFGTTNISFNSSTVKTSFTLDIQKAYNETSFYLDFSNCIIAEKFGFTAKTYTPYTTTSNKHNIINNDKTTYTLDLSNNWFKIIQFTYNVSNINENTIQPSYDIISSIEIMVGEPGISYSRTSLEAEVNYAIQNSPYLDSEYSNIESMIDEIANTEYYNMNIKLNRYRVKPVPNSKVAIIFPEESNIWTGSNSCFYFKKIINQTNVLYAETNCVPSSVKIDSLTNIYFKCKTPSQYASTNLNDMTVEITPLKVYLIDEFIGKLNSLWVQSPYFFNTNMKASINTANDTFNLNIDILKQFDRDSWTIYIAPDSVLTDIFEISAGTFNVCDLSMVNYTFHGRAGSINKQITTRTTKILSYYPNISKNLGNKNDTPYNIVTSNKNFADWKALLSEINKQLTQFRTADTTQQYTLQKSTLDYSGNSITFKIDINYNLTESNYEVYFQDYTGNALSTNTSSITNSWSSLKVDFSYNIDILPYDTSKLTKVLTSRKLELLPIYLEPSNNTFYITPYNSIGAAYHPNNHFKIVLPVTDSSNNKIQYSIYGLINTVNKIFTADPRLVGTKIIPYVKDNYIYITLLLNINIIYTSKDYDIVFYDSVSYIKCYPGATSVSNTTWDSTLGWILGYRDYTSYVLTKENQTESTYYKTSTSSSYVFTEVYSTIFNSMANPVPQIINTIITLTGDTGATTNLYNYFLLVLDDYNQNHLNDGLICITKRETSISLPSYSSKKTTKTCDPATNTEVIISSTNKEGLTQKQLYSVNQAAISKPKNNFTYTSSPNMNDVFAIVSTAPANQQPGTYYTLQGGNLQNHTRVYFGPVNISRFSIRLQTDKGTSLDLNGSNWSFTLVCEQLYRSS